MAEQNLGGGNPGDGNVQPGAGGDGNTPNPQNAPGGGQQPVAGAGGEGNKPGGQGDKQYTYKEDRTDWVPRSRLNEVTGKLGKQIENLQRQFEDQQGRVKKVFGIEEGSEEEREAEEIRKRLYQVVPWLKNLENLTPEQLERIERAAELAEESSTSQWETHAIKMVEDLESEVSSALGVEKLSDTQRRRLVSAYRDEANAAHQARIVAVRKGERDVVRTTRVDNDFIARHERGDKTLIKEFAKAFLDDWFEPARRSAAARLQQRSRPVPSGDRTRTPVTSKTPEINYDDNDAFKKALIDARGGA